MAPKYLETERLQLRHWKKSDLIFFYELNKNPKVMEYFPFTLSKKQSDGIANKIQKELEEKPYGLWAVELKKNQTFIGFIGLHYQELNTIFSPCIEIGWRLDLPFWGHGYATEGAKCVLHYGLNVLKIDEIVAYTAKNNIRSRRVMEKLNMTYSPNDDFLHPKIPKGHPISEHVLYRSNKIK